jgi:hypothetical protein
VRGRGSRKGRRRWRPPSARSRRSIRGKLVAEAEALLDELGDGWLRDQVLGLRTYASALAGESRSFADEVEGCYGARPTYRQPACSSCRSRLGDRARHVPVGLLRLPRRAAEPDPVNVDLLMSAVQLLRLTLHETYPGHHTERCSKEHLLVRGRGLLEETLVIVPTPQTLVTEGIVSSRRPDSSRAKAGRRSRRSCTTPVPLDGKRVGEIELEELCDSRAIAGSAREGEAIPRTFAGSRKTVLDRLPLRFGGLGRRLVTADEDRERHGGEPARSDDDSDALLLSGRLAAGCEERSGCHGCDRECE